MLQPQEIRRARVFGTGHPRRQKTKDGSSHDQKRRVERPAFNRYVRTLKSASDHQHCAPSLRAAANFLPTALSKSKSVTSNTHNRLLHILAPEQLILVRNASKRALGSAVLACTKVVVLLKGVAVLLGEARGQGVLDSDEDVALDERLGTHAGVDAGLAVRVAVVIRVDDVGGAEAQQRHARVDVFPVVVGVGDMQLARVLVAVGVALANQ
jgi:hypothetical protein